MRCPAPVDLGPPACGLQQYEASQTQYKDACDAQHEDAVKSQAMHRPTTHCRHSYFAQPMAGGKLTEFLYLPICLALKHYREAAKARTSGESVIASALFANTS